MYLLLLVFQFWDLSLTSYYQIGGFSLFLPALTVSMHTQGDTIYWKYQDFLPPRSEEIADELARVSGYTKAITPYASGFAGYKDWYISYYNRPGYTVEIGRGINPLPISDFDSIYPANLRLLSKAISLA